MKPRIGITIGDPAGIGPEIVLKALARRSLRSLCDMVVFGDEPLLRRVSKRVLRQRRLPPAIYVNIGRLSSGSIRYGVPTAANGLACGRFIEASVLAALKGRVQALVTAPINKEAFRRGGWGKKYTGHTEMLARLTGSARTALMLVCGTLRAVHVTSHVPLKRVPRLLTRERITETIFLTDKGLRSIGLRRPRIAVCGLNPHAGENGLLGSEEKEVIAPAVRRAALSGLRVEGPLPSDTVWPFVRDGLFDAGVAMYHDQGQIPVKLMGFQNTARDPVARGVNVTLGLPIIRTSPAHGTAYEIAGKGTASEQGFVDAVELAVQMVRRKRR